jgi:hypothetical protein
MANTLKKYSRTRGTLGHDEVDTVSGMRPRFQFHLSTAIVMMVLAAGLLWMHLFLVQEPGVGRLWAIVVPISNLEAWSEPPGLAPSFQIMPTGEGWYPVIVIATMVSGIGIILLVAIALERRVRRKGRQYATDADQRKWWFGRERLTVILLVLSAIGVAIANIIPQTSTFWRDVYSAIDVDCPGYGWPLQWIQADCLLIRSDDPNFTTPRCLMVFPALLCANLLIVAAALALVRFLSERGCVFFRQAFSAPPTARR